MQSITIADDYFERYRASSDFIQQFIFPGGMLPSPSAFARAATRSGLTLAACHAFGPDYAETLRRWRSSFESARNKVTEQGFDAAFIRLWRLYLIYCEVGFDSGRTDVCHFHLQRGA